MTWKASVKLDDDEEGATPYALSIVEVGSARQYDYLRPQTYVGANAFVLCFDVGDYRDETMKDIRERWAAECRSQGAHIPVILVGTKTDQRQGTLRAFTPEQVSETLANEGIFFFLMHENRDVRSPPRFVRRHTLNALL
jgi:GTPase SAR1 family protein